MRSNIVMAFLALAVSAAVAAAPYTGYRIAEVGVRSQSDLVLLRSVGAEPLACFDREGRQEVLATDRQLLAARAAGMQVRVVIQDVDAAIARSNAQRAEARRSGSGGWFADYRTWDEVNDRLDELAAAHPQLASLFTAGQSHEGRDIRGIRITGPGDTSGRGQVLLNGCQHAREWIAVMVPMYLAEHLLTEHDSSTQVASLLSKLEVIIIPIVNPDGYEYTYAPGGYRLWRKNRRTNGGGCAGVDLNRNWDIDWAGGDSTSSNTCSDVYTGPAPFSEPEAAAVRDLVATFDHFIAHIDYHSYSQLVLHPWGWTTAPPPNEAVVTDLATRIADAIGSVHGEMYVPGAPADILYAADGVMQDWTVTQGAFGHTIELRPNGGSGFELPPDQIVPTCEENWAGMLELLEFAAHPVSFSFPAGIPGQFVAGETVVVDVEINALAGTTIDPDTATLRLRWGSGPVVDLPMEWVGGTSYRATLPTSGCGTGVQFAFTAIDTNGTTHAHPSDGTLLVAMAATQVAEWTMDSDPGWSTEGLWDWGAPSGGGGSYGNPDPTAGASGSSVLGYNLAGDYENNLSERHTTSAPLDLTGLDSATLRFARWLNVEQSSYDHAYVRASADGAQWVTLWENGSTITDSGWSVQEFTLPASIIGPSTRIRFTMGTTDWGWQYSGWNIDDVSIWAAGAGGTDGDVNCDGEIDVSDILAIIAAWGDCPVPCNEDLAPDGTVDVTDLLHVIASW